MLAFVFRPLRMSTQKPDASGPFSARNQTNHLRANKMKNRRRLTHFIELSHFKSKVSLLLVNSDTQWPWEKGASVLGSLTLKGSEPFPKEKLQKGSNPLGNWAKPFSLCLLSKKRGKHETCKKQTNKKREGRKHNKCFKINNHENIGVPCSGNLRPRRQSCWQPQPRRPLHGGHQSLPRLAGWPGPTRPGRVQRGGEEL